MNDLLVQKDVVAQLDRELGIGTYEIGVEVHHGAVRLCGELGDEARRQVAECAALTVPDVTTVLNDINIAV